MGEFENWLREGRIILDEGRIIILNATNILLPTRDWIYLFKLLEEKFGKERSREIQERTGEFQIFQALKRYTQLFNVEKMEKENFFNMGATIAEILGLGIWELSRHFTRIKNNPISLEYVLMFGKSSEPIDYYLLGIIRKIYQSYLGKEVEVKETKCIACGDPYCEFQVFPATEEEQSKT